MAYKRSFCLQRKQLTVSMGREGEIKAIDQGHGDSCFIISLSAPSALSRTPGQQSLSLLVPLIAPHRTASPGNQPQLCSRQGTTLPCGSCSHAGKARTDEEQFMLYSVPEPRLV